MILPERVFGQLLGEEDRLRLRDRADQLGRRGRAARRRARRSVRCPPRRITNAAIAWPVVASSLPTTAASATAGWSTSADSTSVVLMLWPDDEHDVVDAAEQPEVAVVVALGAVAREVLAVEAAPVRVAVALGIAPDAAQHRRPRAGRARGSPRPGSRPASPASSTMSASMPGSGNVALPGFSGRRARQRADHDGAGLGLPPRVDDRAPFAADHLVVPDPRLGVDRLADRSDAAAATRGRASPGYCVAPLHERPDRGRRGVEDRRLVLLDDRPEPVLVGMVGRAFVDHARRAVRERAVDDVGVTGDPADVGGAPVDVGVGMEVEDVLVRVRDTA